MKFFFDHDVNAAVADALRRHEHEVTELRDVLPPHADDPVVFAAAQERACVMVTCNRDDFLALASEQPHRGLVILIRRRNARVEATKLLQLIAHAGNSGLEGNVNFA